MAASTSPSTGMTNSAFLCDSFLCFVGEEGSGLFAPSMALLSDSTSLSVRKEREYVSRYCTERERDVSAHDGEKKGRAVFRRERKVEELRGEEREGGGRVTLV